MAEMDVTTAGIPSPRIPPAPSLDQAVAVTVVVLTLLLTFVIGLRTADRLIYTMETAR